MQPTFAQPLNRIRPAAGNSDFVFDCHARAPALA